MKFASRRPVAQAGYFSHEDGCCAPPLWIGIGLSRNEGRGIRMQGFGEYLGSGPEFNEAAHIHNGGGIAHVAHDGQVVRDDHVGNAELTLQTCQQIEDITLYRYIQSGCWFVGEDKLGVERNGPRHSHPPRLATPEPTGGHDYGFSDRIAG